MQLPTLGAPQYYGSLTRDTHSGVVINTITAQQAHNIGVMKLCISIPIQQHSSTAAQHSQCISLLTKCAHLLYLMLYQYLNDVAADEAVHYHLR
jgi:hypothetical protein